MADGNNKASADWLQPPVQQEGLTRYVETLRERFRVVVATVAITLATAILYVATADDVYQAEADLLIRPITETDSAFFSLPVITESLDPTRDIETAARILLDREVAERVVDELELDMTPEEMLGQVTATPVAASNIIAIQARAGTALEAQELANETTAQAVEVRNDQLTGAIEDAIPIIEARLRTASSLTAEDSLQTALVQFQTLRGTGDPTVRVESPAQLPSTPVAPRPTLTVIGGLIGGLVLGVVAAFALQALDPRLRREEQLRREYRLPILARIPRENRRSGPGPLSPLSASPAIAESYRSLRGTLAGSGTPGGGRVVFVTGSSPSEGKSSTALNLASSLATSGRSVILIEADLRRPSIGTATDIQVETGVVQVLIEQAKLEDALVTTSTLGGNLKLLLADHQGGWVSELFGLRRAREVIAEARLLADYVVIDSPPLTDVVDALPLATYSDDVILVVRLGTTKLGRLSQLGELLAENGIRPAGFVVVETPRPSRDQYNYYAGTGSGDQVRRLRPLLAPTGSRSGVS